MNSDPINPSHYKHLPVEAIDIIEAAIEGAPSNKAAFLQGQVIKYLLRCWPKKGIEDLRKAKWYLDSLVASFDEPSESTPDLSKMGVQMVSESDKPKRYRDPTQADLKNGPIACEYRQSNTANWGAGILTCVSDGGYPFLIRNGEEYRQYAQCRIEVGE